VPVEELGRLVVREALDRAGLEPGSVDELILGTAAGTQESPGLARSVALLAGLPQAIPALTVNRGCASGLEAIAQAAFRIAHGAADVLVAAGAESMSRIPLLLSRQVADVLVRGARSRSARGRLGALLRLRPSHLRPQPGPGAGFTDPACPAAMGQTVELLAKEWGIGREEQDRFALDSHLRTARAWSTGVMEEEIAPVPVPPGFERLVREDNGYRSGESLESLASLESCRDGPFGTVTAGNSAQIADGAAAVVLASEQAVRSRGLRPHGWVRACAAAGCEPERPGLAAAHAIPKALAAAGLGLGEVELFEINEASAAQVLACLRALDSDSFCRDRLGLPGRAGPVDTARANVNGGAIAIGHPGGASGVRLALALMREMRRRDAGVGLAAMCAGDGQGMAAVFERNRAC
jgi:acetyl-CoA acetyltransferase family protein